MNIEKMITESRTRLREWLDSQHTDVQKQWARYAIKDHEENTYNWYRQHFKGERFVCVCVRCGSLASSHYSEPYKSRIESQKLCFTCVHGDIEAARYDFASHKRLVIEGWPYSDGGNRPKANPLDKSTMGHGGRDFIITHLQDGMTWETNNLWGGSPILQYWRNKMPDNAVFGSEISVDVYL